jgi:hypothetical protein
MTKRGCQLSLQFDPRKLRQFASRYAVEDDAEALAAGQGIANGEFSRANLSTIFEWKTKGRGRVRLYRNTDEEIADILSLAISAKSDRAKIAVLCGLSGVGVPVASAILTAIDPAEYTIIDFRALEAGTDTADRSVDFYVEYLGACRTLAEKYGISLRDLDRALWQWSAEQSRGRTKPASANQITDSQGGLIGPPVSRH